MRIAIKGSITPSAIEMVRLDHNPSGKDSVTEIKVLAATMISKCQRITCSKRNAETDRCMNEAMRHIEIAAMFAVKGATTES